MPHHIKSIADEDTFEHLGDEHKSQKCLVRFQMVSPPIDESIKCIRISEEIKDFYLKTWCFNDYSGKIENGFFRFINLYNNQEPDQGDGGGR